MAQNIENPARRMASDVMMVDLSIRQMRTGDGRKVPTRLPVRHYFPFRMLCHAGFGGKLLANANVPVVWFDLPAREGWLGRQAGRRRLEEVAAGRLRERRKAAWKRSG
ncbi:MAG: hypothetical protein FWD50_03450 [Betaproteobacteria bacterium]|nr:hypothetical protein [Betaproteobacteria bacterium]